jgi:hypothetical protein
MEAGIPAFVGFPGTWVLHMQIADVYGALGNVMGLLMKLCTR